MLVIGCDYHPGVQHIAWSDTETGECGERRLRHSDGEAEKFYRDLKAKRPTSLVVKIFLPPTTISPNRFLSRRISSCSNSSDSSTPWR